MASSDVSGSSMFAKSGTHTVGVPAGIQEGNSRRGQLAASFVTVWTKHARSARLALPLLRTTNLLYDDCSMHSLPPGHGFPGQHPCLCFQATYT